MGSGPREEAASPRDSSLQEQLSSAILTWIQEDRIPAATRLTERGLAAQLKVSRSPIRAALRRLSEAGYVERTETGRYLVAAAAHRAELDFAASGPDEALYLRIAADHLDGQLPTRVSEAAVSRRYDLTRSQVQQILARIAQEGWAAPLPGHGWEFLPVLSSLKSYRDSYRYRLMVEPLAILEPGYEPDRIELLRRRDEQQELVDGRIETVSAAELFELNTRLHHTVTVGSHNSFIVDGLARINRLRRLIEYRQALVRERARVRCSEHVALVDLLLADRREEASALMREHLSSVSEEKAGASGN